MEISAVLEFGKVIKYLDKGYGFIKSMDQDSEFYKNEVFFHIKSVKKFEDKLVEFASGHVLELYFWFSCKDGKKGKKEVAEFWSDAKDIPQDYAVIILQKYSGDLINAKKSPESFKSLFIKSNIKPVPAIKDNDYSAKSLAIRYSLPPINSEELSTLLVHMSGKNFRLSSELSKYITSNKLGDKYPNIAGIVTMSNDEREWDFDGGFPRDIYKIICQELNLIDKGTAARAIKFTSYQDRKIDLDIEF